MCSGYGTFVLDVIPQLHEGVWFHISLQEVGMTDHAQPELDEFLTQISQLFEKETVEALPGRPNSFNAPRN